MSPPAHPTVFLTGGTGYVGGCYLNRLLASSSSSRPSSITVLSRREETFDLIKSLSTDHTKVIPLQGSFQDYETLTKAASEHDITIEAGDSDNPKLVAALLKGMEQRKKDGKSTTFLHVSGTGTLVDDARGEFKSEEVSPPCLLHALGKDDDSTLIPCRCTPTGNPTHRNCSMSTTLPNPLSTERSTWRSTKPTKRAGARAISSSLAPSGEKDEVECTIRD